MGHSFVPATDVLDTDPLYGFKTDLKDQLTNGTPPNWILRDGGVNERTRSWNHGEWEDAKEQAAERARNRRSNVRERVNDPDSLMKEEALETTFSHPIQCPLNMDRAPNRIADKLQITRKDAQEYTGFNHVSYRDYQLDVYIGVRGGIVDLKIGRDFHH